MSTSVDVDLSFDNDLGVDISGFPSSFTLDIASIPKLTIGVDPITIAPLDVSVRLKEVPSLRTHLPANFSLGISMLGYELVCARLCGEAMVINEPYEPNPCEHCGKPTRHESPGRPQPAEGPG